MAEFILEANERKVDQQSQLTKIRENSRVPGVVYGFSQEPLAVDMDYNQLLKIVKSAGTSGIITLKVGQKNLKVIIREYQQNPISDKLSHIDFMAVDEKRPLTTKIPLEFFGTSKAVREQGGQIDIKSNQISVKCLPKDLPEKIVIDLGNLSGIGQKLLVRDLKIDDKVTVLDNPNDPVVSVIMPKKIKLVTDAATTEVPVAGAAPTDSEAKEGETKEGEAKKE
ncbi:50S ribosomal protein L25 [Candidatus Parcubacteria bacterium]|nr:MAG: 50S ribosomal protein L25 [Candidatus Parcubacteria bacterium]